MSREEVIERLHEIFWDVFDDVDIRLTDATTSDDNEDWDSLELIKLVVEIENQFGMKFSMGEVHEMKNVGEMVDISIERATK